MVTHNADSLYIRENCEELLEFAFDAALFNLITEYSVRFLKDLYFFFCYLTNDSYAKSRTREWLSPYEFMRNAELFTDLTDFILEKITERFDNSVKCDILRHLNHVVVCLYSSSAALAAGIALAAFDTVRINSALCKESAFCFFTYLVPEYLVEFGTDYLSLLLRISYSLKFFKELLLTVYSYKIHIEKTGKCFLNEVTLVLSHKSLIDKYAGELFADCTA